ncbi:MAG: amidohydrolase family protein [Planctomycetales bacterium]|nr:amidohydrolase family protein [Planctomycetales bacterium]
MEQNRRDILKAAAAGLGTLGGAWAPIASHARAAENEAVPANLADLVGLPANWQAIRKLDVHNHVFMGSLQGELDWDSVDRLVAAAEFLGIDRMYCSRPITGGALADIAQVRQANDAVLAAMRRYPQQIIGFCFVQPDNGAAALKEIDRCLEAGMAGIKLYNQYKYSNPLVFPIAEHCIERRIPFLGHSGHVTDARTQAAQPNISDSLDFCQLSFRYPELKLILGHINGGGDWEWSIKGLRNCPHVYVDTSGGILENDTIEMCVRELGHKRLLFATDLTMEGGVGKILSADLTAEQREDIFWRNFQRILDQRST